MPTSTIEYTTDAERVELERATEDNCSQTLGLNAFLDGLFHDVADVLDLLADRRPVVRTAHLRLHLRFRHQRRYPSVLAVASTVLAQVGVGSVTPTC